MTKAETKNLAEVVLQNLRAAHGRRSIWAVANSLGMTSDADYDRFLVAVNAIPKSKIIRVRGQNGFLIAA